MSNQLPPLQPGVDASDKSTGLHPSLHCLYSGQWVIVPGYIQVFIVFILANGS